MGTQGMCTQGMGTQGMGTHGMGTQGMGTQGMGTQGMCTQGMGTHGMGTHGMGTQGMGTLITQGRGEGPPWGGLPVHACGVGCRCMPVGWAAGQAFHTPHWGHRQGGHRGGTGTAEGCPIAGAGGTACGGHGPLAGSSQGSGWDSSLGVPNFESGGVVCPPPVCMGPVSHGGAQRARQWWMRSRR